LLNQRVLCGILFTAAIGMTGCGTGVVSRTGLGNGVTLQGAVHGGQQGIGGATLQLYTVGSGGNGSAAIPMLTSATMTGADGTFSITGGYNCGQDSSGNAITGGSGDVYLVATGGNPGLAAGTNNAALAMVAALGPCSSLSGSTFIYVNELTTVAAAWALAPFSTAVDHIGASGTNTLGIGDAFLDAGLLADTTTGAVATIASNLTVETGKMNALADALASCINSDGTTACGPLFSAATEGSTPTDTFTAALDIVKHPGSKVTDVFQAIGTYVPFPTTLTKAPNDWTMSLTVTGGGLLAPTALGIDSQNNVWVAGQDGPLFAFNAQGMPLSATGFGGANGSEIAQVYGLAIDPSDNIWVTNFNGGGGSGSVTEFYGVGSGQLGVSPQPRGYAAGNSFPYAIAADTNGDIFIADTGTFAATVFNSSGMLIDTNLGAAQNLESVPQAIAIDTSHGFWLPGDAYVAHISAPSADYPNGQLLSKPNCCALSYGVATDAAGKLWVADYLGGASGNGAFADIGSDGSLLLSGVSTGGINHPALVAIDADQNVFFSNLRAASITEVAGNGGSVTAGTALSPSTGVYGTGGFGLDASLDAPFGIAADRSGNLWVSNENVDAITMFFGLAAPTVTPLQPVPTAP
jgi:hypothetical protein